MYILYFVFAIADKLNAAARAGDREGFDSALDLARGVADQAQRNELGVLAGKLETEFFTEAKTELIQ